MTSKFSMLCGLLGASLLAAGGAAAAPLDYSATLDLQVGTITAFQLEASGQVSVDPDGSFDLPAAVFATTRTLTPPQTPSEAIASVQLQIANAPGSFNGFANPGGVMLLTGQAVLNLQPGLGFDPLTLGLSPLGATGGTATVMGSNGAFSVTASLTGAPWQVGVFQQTGITASGSTFGKRTNTGADLRSAGGEGVLTMVVPVYLTTRLNGSFSEASPVTGVLSITFTPEPGRLLADGAMLCVIAALYVRTRRRRGRTPPRSR